MTETIDFKKLGDEYADVLRRVISGESTLICVGQTWDEAYAADVAFTVDGWHISIFNDCDSVDYTDSITAPDGRHAEFSDLFDICADPICYTTFNIDNDEIERALKAARRARND